MIEPGSLNTVASYLIKFKSKALYPGFPFFSVPAVVVFLIIIQFKESMSLSPEATVAALHFESSMSSGDLLSSSNATLVVVPKGAKRFSLPTEDSEFTGVRVSEDIDSLRRNSSRIELTESGLTIDDQWVDSDYPLALLVEGAAADNILPTGEKIRAIPKLELDTSESVWIALGAAVAAVFSIGLAAGFLKDSAPIT